MEFGTGKSLVISLVNIIKQVVVKEEIRKILQTNEKTSGNQILLQKCHQRNKPPVFSLMRKLMTMLKALHLRDGTDRLYSSRKYRGRKLSIIEDCVDASIRELEEQKKNNTAATNNTENLRTNRIAIRPQKQKWVEKWKYGYFKRQIGEISHGKTGICIRKGNFEKLNSG